MTDHDEKPVGYGNPPRQHRFQPGRSGNPKGKPKKGRSASSDNSYATLLKEAGTEVIHHQGREMTLLEREIIEIQRAAAMGEVAASKFLAHLRAQAGMNEEPDQGGGVLSVPMPVGCWSLEEAMDRARKLKIPCKLARDGATTDFYLG